MADDFADKTHAPTPRRREQARRDGQVAQSQDLGSVVLLLGSLAALVLVGGGLVEFLLGLLRTSLGGDAWKSWQHAGDAGQVVAGQAVAGHWNALVSALGGVLLPVLAGAALLTAAVDWWQTGFLFRPARALPDLSRVDPGAGLGRMFSAANYARLALGVGKVAVVAAVAAVSLWNRRAELVSLSALEVPQLAAHVWHIALVTCLEMGVALAVLAVVDYGVQRWQLERRLRMTTQEVREEMRELGGDPQIAARRRSLRHAHASVGMAPGGKSRTPPTASPDNVGAVDAIR